MSSETIRSFSTKVKLSELFDLSGKKDFTVFPNFPIFTTHLVFRYGKFSKKKPLLENFLEKQIFERISFFSCLFFL